MPLERSRKGELAVHPPREGCDALEEALSGQQSRKRVQRLHKRKPGGPASSTDGKKPCAHRKNPVVGQPSGDSHTEGKEQLFLEGRRRWGLGGGGETLDKAGEFFTALLVGGVRDCGEFLCSGLTEGKSQEPGGKKEPQGSPKSKEKKSCRKGRPLGRQKRRGCRRLERNYTRRRAKKKRKKSPSGDWRGESGGDQHPGPRGTFYHTQGDRVHLMKRSGEKLGRAIEE